MPLQPDADMVLTDYSVDDAGIHLHFVCSNPGPGEPSDYFALLTDGELAGATTVENIINALTTKLKRTYRLQSIAPKLDGLIGTVIRI